MAFQKLIYSSEHVKLKRCIKRSVFFIILSHLIENLTEPEVIKFRTENFDTRFQNNTDKYPKKKRF